MKTKHVFASALALVLAIGVLPSAFRTPVYSQDAKSAAKLKAAAKVPDKPLEKAPEGAAELDKLRASAKEFEKAFNAGDAAALANLFAEKAEVVDEDGTVIIGRANIEARFAGSFKEFPKAKIAVEITLLRQLGPDIAVEDGVSTVTLDPAQPASRSPYALVHVKRDGKWLFASVRDFPEEKAETAHDHLTQLEWLVGKWVDESREGRVETHCQWSADGNYLLQDYVIKSRRGHELRGTQRIAWDPSRRTVRAWAFDQSGAFTESTWTPVESGWVIKAEGTTADGQALSMSRMLTSLTNDSFQIDSSSQVLGGELLSDSTVRVVRLPPPPSE